MYMFKESTEDLMKTELSYWRKHPNLHGFIVKSFAAGVDECQKIPLTAEDIEQTLKAISEDKLPQTSGFFFGQSASVDSADKDERKYALAQKAQDLEAFKEALAAVKHDGDKVFYQASW